MATKAITASDASSERLMQSNLRSRDALMDMSARANGRDRVPMCHGEWIVGGA